MCYFSCLSLVMMYHGCHCLLLGVFIKFRNFHFLRVLSQTAAVALCCCRRRCCQVSREDSRAEQSESMAKKVEELRIVQNAILGRLDMLGILALRQAEEAPAGIKIQDKDKDVPQVLELVAACLLVCFKPSRPACLRQGGCRCWNSSNLLFFSSRR